MVNWNETNAKISPGMLIESLVICIICGRRPLWKVEQFWEGQDLKLRSLAAKHIQFISRLPETFKLAQELKDLAWQSDNWHDIGTLAAPKNKKAAYYKTFLVKRELDGRKYDFVVVQSSALEVSKEKTLKRRIDIVTNKGFVFQGAVKHNQQRTYSHKGRPRKDEQPVVKDIYHSECSVGDIQQDFYEHLMQKESTFILIADVKDKLKYDDKGILEEYKHLISIETKFRFLKNPVYLGPVFLENQNRIDALCYLFILVVLIGSYLEYRVRKSLKETGQALIQPGNKRNVRPSIMTY